MTSVRPISASHFSQRKSKACREESKALWHYKKKNKSKKSSDVSGCDFQKHGNKTPGTAWQGVGGKKKKELKLSDKSNGCLQLNSNPLTSKVQPAKMPFSSLCCPLWVLFQPPSSLFFFFTTTNPPLPPHHLSSIPSSSTLPYPLKEYCTH